MLTHFENVLENEKTNAWQMYNILEDRFMEV